MYDVAFERLSELYSESGHPFPGSAASFTLTNLHPSYVDAIAEASDLLEVASIVSRPLVSGFCDGSKPAWTVPVAPADERDPDLDCDG